MSKKILVVYASRGSSTAETADKVAHELSVQLGLKVEVASVKRAKYIASYDSIVIGTAIRMGRPLPEAISFAKSYQPILSTKKVAIFGMCMVVKNPSAENKKSSSIYLDSLKALLNPIDTQLFAGKINPARLGFMARLVIKLAKTPIGDFRNWDEIKAWSAQLGQKL
jgi:menaquinone-dependent protoporphyrinogen oxidase